MDYWQQLNIGENEMTKKKKQTMDIKDLSTEEVALRLDNERLSLERSVNLAQQNIAVLRVELERRYNEGQNNEQQKRKNT